MSNYSDCQALSLSFDTFFESRAYRVLNPVKITSKIDKTVYLTNSATNLFRLFFDKGEYLCVRQRSMRTQILNDYYNPISETEYPSYFVSFGVFVPPSEIQKLIDDTIDFNIKIGFQLSKMCLRISSEETFLTSYTSSSLLAKQVCLDTKDRKYDHVYGANLTGRAIKLDYYQDSIQRYKNLGYFLVIKQGQVILGAEYASSDQLINMRMREIRYGISASLVGDILETDSFEKRRFSDCIVGCSHLIYEGIVPNSSNTNGRTLKKYVAGLVFFADALSITNHEIITLMNSYLKLEYAPTDEEIIRIDALLTRALH